jgi:glycosyltransferase involved in cell wall biosynthesis
VVYKVKILYVIHEFFPKHYTGTARVGLNLAKQMQKMGNEVKVLTYGLSETDGMIASGNILYKKYVYDSVQVFSIKDKNMSPEINFRIFNRNIENDIKQIIESESLDDTDIVHVVHPLRMGIVAKIFKEKKIPIVLTLTDYWTICPRVQLLKSDYSICNGSTREEKCRSDCAYGAQEIKNRIKEALFLLDLADIITVPTNVARHIFNINGFNNKKIQVVNHGLDYKYFNIINTKLYSKDDTVSFGYIGPILKHKGLHILINAFLKVKMSQIKLKIYGSYLHERNYYNDLKILVNGDSRIIFMGEFAYDNLSNIFKEIDVAIFPSIWYETYCLALTESLSHNVPVIASNTVGSAIEFLKNESGIVFNSGDVEELARIIENMGKNPLLINNLKRYIIYPPMIEEEALCYQKLYLSELAKLKKERR